ncbi:hypothetical protein POJ06DRAFT_241123 [Lipomyces tetrasporus]|uniref:Uncharacterized protein n=1 Tax=Lipomyces tetrasporus TaxID=54092 RepID=A0AAD7QLL9_9ASCO|nr:uncharacterized protein POJ06DRAFT_241123 [Lipomyces tetrasporus]KAJ8097116.1 hypothetical protein POJ06DRAFT_241123 [Lipomyces tetrasporus]
MADYIADEPIHESPDIRHCIAGDAIISILGYPLVVCDLYLAVADEQVEDALTVILQQGHQQTRGRDCYVDKKATIAPLGWPGYRLTSSELLPATVNACSRKFLAYGSFGVKFIRKHFLASYYTVSVSKTIVLFGCSFL